MNLQSTFIVKKYFPMFEGGTCAVISQRLSFENTGGRNIEAGKAK